MNAFSDAPTPTELYRRWERRHWHAQAVDFSQDRREWLDLSDEERWQWCWLAGFSHFRASEIHAVLCSARLLPCLARPEQKYFLATQVADEARHAYFFQRFYDEVMGAELPTETQGPLTISPSYQRLFLDSLTEVVDSAVNHPSHANVAVAAFQAFVVLEGSIAIATFTVIRRILTKLNRFPGLLEGMTYAHQDEVRHAQFGISLLQDIFATEPSSRDAVIAHLRELLPLFSEVLVPRPGRKAVLKSLGLDPYERRRRAFTLLQRKLRALGIDAGFIEPCIAAG